MNFDGSLANFINNPNEYHLELEGDNLKALPGNPKFHKITHEKLLELSKSSSTLARDVFTTLRGTEVGVGTIRNVLSPQSEVAEASIFKEGLAIWVEEKIGTDEYQNRIIAANKIIKCYSYNLKNLDLSGLQLSSLPSQIGNLTKLQNLNLSSNELDSLPSEIGNLFELNTLDLSNNKFITLPPQIVNLTKLETLNLFSNLLTSLPNQIGNLVHLKGLNLFNNKLSSLPLQIADLFDLKNLDLSFNELTSVPSEIANLQKLENFNLSNNLLRSLPSSYTRLGENCSINAENNLIPLTEVESFQLDLQRIRNDTPAQCPQVSFSIFEPARVIEGILEEGEEVDESSLSLEETILLWEKALERSFPRKEYPKVWAAHDQERSPGDTRKFYEPLLSHEKNNLLHKFLQKLKKTEDYKNSSKILILRVDRMLHGASVNEKFRNNMFLILDDALETCGDRVTDAFDIIEIQWYLHCGSGELDQIGVAKLLLGLERAHILDKFARKKIEKIKKTPEGATFKEDLQVFLYFRVKLAPQLGIPTSTEGMLYPLTSGVTDEELEEAEYAILAETSDPKIIISILTSSEIWAEKLKETTSQPFDEINEDIQGKLDLLYDNQKNMIDQEYRNENTRLMNEKKKRTDTLVLKLTQDFVKKNYNEIY